MALNRYRLKYLAQTGNRGALRTTQLLAQTDAWEEVVFEDPAQAPISYAHPAQAV